MGGHSWLSFVCHSVGGSQLVVVRLSFGGGSQLVVVRLSFGGGSQLVVVRLSFGRGGHSWLSFGCHSVGGSQLVVVRLSFGGGITECFTAGRRQPSLMLALKGADAAP